jgi:GMP synthase-like glutamine amidotransferase
MMSAGLNNRVVRIPDHRVVTSGCLLLLTFLGQARKVRRLPAKTGGYEFYSSNVQTLSPLQQRVFNFGVRQMRIHHLQHVEFEGLGSIEPHLINQEHQLSATHLYLNEPLPELDSFDALIVMGGPMSVSDEANHPWLKPEKEFISRTITSGKKVLGICLGAQLIATALGANVYRNKWREIGWWSVSQTETAAATDLGLLPASYVPFHWHGDTFDLPDGAIHLAENPTCPHQAFSINNKIIGLQFHLETTPKSARELIKHAADELDGSRYVQTAEQILAVAEHFTVSNRLMSGLLNRWLNDETAA